MKRSEEHGVKERGQRRRKKEEETECSINPVI